MFKKKAKTQDKPTTDPSVAAQPQQPAQELQAMPNPMMMQPNAGYQPNMQQQPMMMMPQQPMPTPPPSGKGGVSGLMSNVMGGNPVQDQRGMLDNDLNQDPTGRTPNPRVHNQDLWLLSLFFKGCAFAVYFLLPIVFPKALTYIIVLMLTSIDFWVVKNIVGRKLVKMRWWFIIDDQGNERWHYESREHPILFQDKLVFWGSLYAFPLVWLLFCVMNAITLQIFEVATTFVCALINAVQWWGFKNCKSAHERKMKIMKRRQAGGGRRKNPAVGPGMQPLGQPLLPPPGQQMPMQQIPYNPNYRQ